MDDNGNWLRGEGPSLTRVDLTRPLPVALAPMNLAAERNLLGILLYDNSRVDAVATKLRPEAFGEPFHGRLYARIVELVGARRLADPVTLRDEFAGDEAFAALGGIDLLADLFEAAPPSTNAPDYADVIVEAWRRRETAVTGLYLAAAALQGEDTTAAIAEAERALTDVQASTRTIKVWSAADAIDAVMHDAEHPELSPAVKTGIEPLDKALGGLMPGELVLLAGRSSMGKSAVANCIALNVAWSGIAADGRRQGWFEINGEMDSKAMMRRHLVDRAFTLSPKDAPSYKSLRDRDPLSPQQWALVRHVADELRTLRTLVSVKKTGLSISALRALVRRQQLAWEREDIVLAGISVDHVGLIRSDREWRGRTEEQTNVAIAIKELADELEIPILGLVQINRQTEARDDKRPTLSDLKDSGAWEENADAVVGFYRDAYYARREREPKQQDKRHEWEMRQISKTIEGIMLKVREGDTGTVQLWGDLPRNAIRARAPDNMYGEAPGLFGSGPAGARSPEPPPVTAYDGPDYGADEFE